MKIIDAAATRISPETKWSLIIAMDDETWRLPQREHFTTGALALKMIKKMRAGYLKRRDHVAWLMITDERY